MTRFSFFKIFTVYGSYYAVVFVIITTATTARKKTNSLKMRTTFSVLCMSVV